eukprot:4399102-Pyramimonas_sp.AAC.1
MTVRHREAHIRYRGQKSWSLASPKAKLLAGPPSPLHTSSCYSATEVLPTVSYAAVSDATQNPEERLNNDSHSWCSNLILNAPRILAKPSQERCPGELP